MPKPATVEFNDSELSVLKSIREAESLGAHLTQRELASRVGVSLGMANILLRRLAERGWVKLTRLSAKSLRYALTPEGMRELAQRTVGYFRRASNSADQYRDRIESFIIEAKRKGAETLVLLGSSDLDLLIGYVCERHGLVFIRSSDFEKSRNFARKSGVILLLAEGMTKLEIDAASTPENGQKPASLADLLSSIPSSDLR